MRSAESGRGGSEKWTEITGGSGNSTKLLEGDWSGDDWTRGGSESYSWCDEELLGSFPDKISPMDMN